MPAFPKISLQPAVRAAVEQMGITEPTPIQAEAIPVLLAGRDMIGQARTGSGKTLAFALPIVERCDPATKVVQALVLVPTRELALQVGEVLGKVASARHLRLVLLYGGRSLRPDLQALQRGPQIVVGTPGRTLDHLRQGALSLRGLRVFVLDEADEMLDQGFAPDVERILGFAPAVRQTALFSATMPPWVAKTAARYLRNPATVQVDANVLAPPEIEHIAYQVDAGSKLSALRALLDHRGEGAVLVFGRTKHGVKKLALQLVRLGYPTAALQGNLSQNARERVMADFRSGRLPILLATNVAARGIDVQDIELVINYELPETPELFTHRIGRTGRMGRAGKAVALITTADTAKWREIERALGRRLAPQAWPYGALAQSPPAPSAVETVRPPRGRGRDADSQPQGLRLVGRQSRRRGPRRAVPAVQQDVNRGPRTPQGVRRGNGRLTSFATGA